MSIHNFSDKIKSKMPIDKMTFLYFCIIIGVGVGSFGLGRLSNDFGVETNKENGIIIEESNYLEKDSNLNNDEVISIDKTIKRYVASKNGKMYYSIGCSGAKRIKKENEVWFSSKEDAEKSGYELSSTCK